MALPPNLALPPDLPLSLIYNPAVPATPILLLSKALVYSQSQPLNQALTPQLTLPPIPALPLSMAQQVYLALPAGLVC